MTADKDLVNKVVAANPKLTPATPADTGEAKRLAKEFGEAVQPRTPPKPDQAFPLPDVHDPLCPVTAPPSPPRRGLPTRPAAQAP